MDVSISPSFVLFQFHIEYGVLIISPLGKMTLNPHNTILMMIKDFFDLRKGSSFTVEFNMGFLSLESTAP